MRTILRYLLGALAIVLIAAGAVSWWFIYRPLPQLDGTISLPGLQKEATVERDEWGVPHIRAASLEDLAEAQGYVMAQDRLWQMDLLRRVARGQLSEILGARTLDTDKEFRTLQFGKAADRDFGLLDNNSRIVIEAYARGINRFIGQHPNQLPIEFSLLGYKPTPWLPTDTLVISGYMYQTLTNTWRRKIDRAKVVERVGFDRAKYLFSQDSLMDHYVIGDPDVPNDGSQNSEPRDDSNDDDDDDDMSDPVIKTSASTTGPLACAAVTAPESNAPSTGSTPSLSQLLSQSLAPAPNPFPNWSEEIRQSLGSNNWVVSGDHTASGKPLLANDPHLELRMPSIWYEVHLTSPGFNVKGFTLPGAPLIIIGHNDRVAWGFTNNNADVEDIYIETFNPTNPNEYRVHGKWTAAQVSDELIRVKGQADQHLKIVVTRHGPIVYQEGDKSYALRWTATEPGGLSSAYNWLGKARNWDEFRELMKQVHGPAQNTVYADVAGNIGYIVAAQVPLRKKGHGEVPVPGDTDDYEWTGYIPFDRLPQALNPESGFIATANARVVGPAYKEYLTDRWEEPYRTARIYDLLLDKHDLRPVDMLKVQDDAYSYPHVFLSEQLIAASKIAQPKDERTKRLIASLKDWNGFAEPDSPVIPFLDAMRRQALVLLLEPYLGKDTALYKWRTMTFLQNILTDRPDNWLPKTYKSYDELLLAAADRGVADLTEQTKSPRIEDWPGKRFTSLEMYHPLGQEGLLRAFLSIAPQPQSGTLYSVRAANRRHGPSMRFIADLGNWDNSILVMASGESGQPGSTHYSDQFSDWYRGQPIIEPFSESAESKIRKHKLTLKPTK